MGLCDSGTSFSIIRDGEEGEEAWTRRDERHRVLETTRGKFKLKLGGLRTVTE